MEYSDCQGYVFSENKRIIIKWIVPLVSLLGCCFSLSCLRLAVIYSENRGTHILISILFAFLSGLQILVRKKVVILFSLQYICGNNAIQNVMDKLHTTIVDTHSSFFISQICVEGNSKIPWSEYFYVLSNKPIVYVSNHEGNGMRVVQSLVKNGVVILPKNKTSQMVIEHVTDDMIVPVYPKVAYRQQ